MRGLQIRPSHAFGGCTTPTFLHTHVLLTCLQSTKVTITFGYLRELGSWRSHQQPVSRHRSRSRALLPKVSNFEFTLPGRRSSPSARWRLNPSDRRSWSLCLRFRVAIRYLRPSEGDILRTEGHGLQACASQRSSDTFGCA